MACDVKRAANEPRKSARASQRRSPGLLDVDAFLRAQNVAALTDYLPGKLVQ